LLAFFKTLEQSKMKSSGKITHAVPKFAGLLFIFLIGYTLHAQTLSERLGAVSTDFSFFSGETDLEVSHQFIIKSGGAYHKMGTMFDGGYGYGAGYDTYRLEFVTRKALAQDSRRRIEHHFRMSFYNEEDELLASYNFAARKVSVLPFDPEEDSLLFYSVDLLDIPVSLLDFTRKIDVIEVQ
jgi:hypothetical protein